MTLDLADCILTGSAMTTPFLHDGLHRALDLSRTVEPGWDVLRGSLRAGGPHRVHKHLTAKLASALGYDRPVRQEPVNTREGSEDGGWMLQAANGARLRVWSIASNTDLDAIDRTSSAHRTSPTRIAQRVLLSRGEHAGLVTNGDVVRLLLCDSSRSDSHLSVPVSGWRARLLPPDSYRVLVALAGAEGLPRLPGVLEAARLHQAKVTIELRCQARDAITGFINALPHRTNLDPAALWHEGLILVYRLLFILKLESPTEPGAGFSFASVRLWRTALSPNRALGPLVRRHLDHGHDTGRMLESGLRSLFSIFRDGLTCAELKIAPLGGALFGTGTTPLLDGLEWGERAVAILLDRLIWLLPNRGERTRVHYGSLNVEDLGSIYEGLLEQEPRIATESLIRRRRGRLESILPARAESPDIERGQFYLRAGMRRKATGSFYTPHEFVHFLVQQTLDPKIASLSPIDDPHPANLLTLRIVDPATGSGHFLVEACRYLGEALLTACCACDELGLHDRIALLPDPDNTITSYLPSRGFSKQRARAICRRLVAVHCLYGCDRNKLAIELAKLSLWLESYAEGLPLTFLDHRLVHGDALSGPFFESLSTLPVTGGRLDPLLADGVAKHLAATLDLARKLVSNLSASIGRDVVDLELKQMTKSHLDQVLYPLQQLARSWAGAAMQRARDSDDIWLGLAKHVTQTGLWPDTLTDPQSALLELGADAVAWDLIFPEVFPDGFSAVLGNPPWDVVLPNTKDFVADYDPAILDARTRTERSAIEQSVLSQPAVALAFDAYRNGFDHLKRIAGRLYSHQRFSAGGMSTAGSLDLFRLFAERNFDLAASDGAIGLLMPSAFHANEGATGIRHLYLQETDLRMCLSFENRRRVFDIDSRFKFDLIVAQRPGPTQSIRCGFYLDRIEDADNPAKIMAYDTAFLDKTSGDRLTPLELRGNADLQVAEKFFSQRERMRKWCMDRHIHFGCDLHMTADSGCFQRAGAAPLSLFEGKTFHQYIDRWDAKPRFSVNANDLKPRIAEAARYYRLVFRDIARSNDERTMIACIVPPGIVFGHTATVEKAPWARANAEALVLCALFNSFPFDWLVRQKAAAHLSLYLLDALPVPQFSESARRFLAHAALRLSCNHAGYDELWREQTAGKVVPERTEGLRARIDVVVAHAYGLDREQYARVLESFSHRSNRGASTLCAAAFDELKAWGLTKFCRRHDPLADVPLVTTRAEPSC